MITLGLSLYSCEVSDCKNCEVVTYENGVEISRQSAVEYCGDDLNNVENQAPVVIGNKKTVYECY
jgi:hypothetical protein